MTATRRPLVVSVRSGAAVSMPGMMETLLDVGLNAITVEALIRETGNPRLAWDSYRRLVQGYAEIVAQLPTAPFEQLVAAELLRCEADHEDELDHRSLRTLTQAMLDCYRAMTGGAFPADPHEQLCAATAAVLGSWNSPKAISYRRLNHLSDAAGTAVTVQRMVYGNAGATSGAGVAFTRDPATGEREMYFDFQFNAQGEDVVGGRQRLQDRDRLRRVLPKMWTRLNEICRELEALQGAQTLFGSVELFILEVSLFEFAPRTPLVAEAVGFMAQRGYEVYDLPGLVRRPSDGALGQIDIAFARRGGPLRASCAW